jgi:hypothetical protein
MKLVKLVFEKRLSIRKAGRRLLIKPSTAKLIIKKFKETGSVEPKIRQPIPEERGHVLQEESEEVIRSQHPTTFEVPLQDDVQESVAQSSPLNWPEPLLSLQNDVCWVYPVYYFMP